MSTRTSTHFAVHGNNAIIQEAGKMGTLSLSGSNTPVASFDSGTVREYLTTISGIKKTYGRYSSGFSGVMITDSSGSEVGCFDPSSGILRSSSSKVYAQDIAYVKDGRITDTNVSAMHRRTLGSYSGDSAGAAAAYALYVCGRIPACRKPAETKTGDSSGNAGGGGVPVGCGISIAPFLWGLGGIVICSLLVYFFFHELDPGAGDGQTYFLLLSIIGSLLELYISLRKRYGWIESWSVTCAISSLLSLVVYIFTADHFGYDTVLKSNCAFGALLACAVIAFALSAAFSIVVATIAAIANHIKKKKE